MTRPFLLSPKHLKEQAHARMEPEFAAATRELELAHRHADEMLETGRLTKEEHDDFEAHLYSKFIEALPVSEFQELVKNGGMDYLQSLAGYDESRGDAGDVEDTRKAIEAKIKADAPIVADFTRRFGKTINFGVPSWVAVQAIAMSISKSCADGKVSRAEVLKNMKSVTMAHSLLGKPVAFLANGDVKGGINFSLFQIQEDGSYNLVQAG